MSLRLKYLFTLNLVIALALGGYGIWNYRESVKSHMHSEVNALRHLGSGISLLVIQAMDSPEGMRGVQKRLDTLSEQWKGLDVMILDKDFRVLASTMPDRLGQRWKEEDIRKVLDGKRTRIWKTKGHQHDGQPSFDSTIAVPDKNGEIQYAVHIARHLEVAKAASRKQGLRDLLFTAFMLLIVGLAINILTYRFVIAPLDKSHEIIKASGWLKENKSKETKDEVQRINTILKNLLASVTTTTSSLKKALKRKDELLAEVERLRNSLDEEVQRVREELLQTQDKLLRAERLASLGRLSGGLAHEIRNPLHIIRGTAETARRRISDCSAYADDIIEEVDRIQELISRLLDYTQPITPNLQPVNALSLLQKVKAKKECAEPWPEGGSDKSGCGETVSIEIRCDLNDGALLADELLISQALLNMVSNACEASPPGKTVHIEAKTDGDFALFQVKDEGKGISPSDQEKVFEPFFTRKPAGTGLGLCIVQRIADLHEGEAIITSQFNKEKQTQVEVDPNSATTVTGTTVTLKIPLRPDRKNTDKNGQKKYGKESNAQESNNPQRATQKPRTDKEIKK